VSNEAVIDIAGNELTTIVFVAVAVQPEALVLVTVYVVVAEGDTVIELPVAPPGSQTKVAVPEADKVTESPMQMADTGDKILTLQAKRDFPVNNTRRKSRICLFIRFG
jgi:hypothetical protein